MAGLLLSPHPESLKDSLFAKLLASCKPTGDTVAAHSALAERLLLGVSDLEARWGEALLGHIINNAQQSNSMAMLNQLGSHFSIFKLADYFHNSVTPPPPTN